MPIIKRFQPDRLINLTPIQNKYRLLDLKKNRFILVPSGRRSRKTLIGKRKVLVFALQNPGVHLFLGAPTQQQAKRIFWKKLKLETTYFRFSVSEVDLTITLYNGSTITVVGLDKPERIEGQVWNGCHITEVSNLKSSAWIENIRPALADTQGFAILDGVPEGRNWFYDLALKACGGAIPKTRPIIGAEGKNNSMNYFSWFSSDVLPPEEIADLKDHMDERTFRQEMEGSFESVEGLAYYNFGPTNIKQVVYRPGESVVIGMDFNVDPMTAVFCYMKGNKLYQFGEAYLRNSNTVEMAEYIAGKFNNPGLVTIIPDATGSARDSTSTKTDLAILRDKGFNVRGKKSNPRVKDRLNSVNALLKTASGKVRYFIDPSCKHTIADLNRVERTSDGRENKDQERDGLVHISSALGYLVNFYFPILSGEFTNK